MAGVDGARPPVARSAPEQLADLAREALAAMDRTGKVDGFYRTVMAAADPAGWRARNAKTTLARLRTLVAGLGDCDFDVVDTFELICLCDDAIHAVAPIRQRWW